LRMAGDLGEKRAQKGSHTLKAKRNSGKKLCRKQKAKGGKIGRLPTIAQQKKSPDREEDQTKRKGGNPMVPKRKGHLDKRKKI